MNRSKWEEWNKAAAGTFWDMLGCKIESADERRVVVSLDIQPCHLNLIGIMHGGVYATLIDSAMGLLAMIARPDDRVVTTNLNLHYLNKADHGRLEVTAELISQTNRTITAIAYAKLEDGTLCTLGTGTFRVI